MNEKLKNILEGCGLSAVGLFFWHMFADMEMPGIMIAIFAGIPLFFGVICFFCAFTCTEAELKEVRENASKEPISAEYFNRMLKSRLFLALESKKDYFLNEFKNDSDYLMLEELFKYLPTLSKQYFTEILTAPLTPSRPIDPYTAGFIGSQIGGVVVGVVAAENAIIKEQQYQEQVQKVIESKINVGNALDKVQSCYLSIEAILNSKESTKKVWETEKNSIYNELHGKYKIRYR